MILYNYKKIKFHFEQLHLLNAHLHTSDDNPIAW